VAAPPRFLDFHAGPHLNRTPTGFVGLPDSYTAADETGGRKIGPLNIPHESGYGDFRIVEQGHDPFTQLPQIVRRDIGRHPDGNPRRTVEQQVGNPGRQHQRLQKGVVVVRLERDGFLFNVSEEFMAKPVHANFGIPHGSRRVTVHRPEVALPVNERIAHGKRLCHPHQGIVDRGITMRMVFTDDITHNACRLLVRLVEVIAQFMHGKEDAAMNRFQAIAHIGNGATDDNAHRIVEIRKLDLVFDIDCF